jgi:hypothetical protein
MTGNPFYSSARESFYLIVRNAQRFGVVHGLGSIFIFFGQILITLLATIAGYIFITESDYFEGKVYSAVVPSVVAIVIVIIA